MRTSWSEDTLKETDFAEGGGGFGPDDDGKSSATDVAFFDRSGHRVPEPHW